jgi:AcrR family transcriptional regulator
MGVQHPRAIPRHMSPKDRAADARRRLLEAASELFSAEGINTVGIERVVERAGVAKATLYNSFGSKEELIRAYLEDHHSASRERMERELSARYVSARERLVGVFEVQGEDFAEPSFRGCAFIKASSEAQPGGVVERATSDFRAWVSSLFIDLARQAGVRAPEQLARQLVLIYDGAAIGAWLDQDPNMAATTRSVAAALVSAAVPVEADGVAAPWWRVPI